MFGVNKKGTGTLPVGDSETQDDILKILRQFLGIPKIKATDNFFQIGLDSMALMDVFNQLKPQIPELKLTDLFNYPSVENLSRFLDSRRSLGAEPSARAVSLPAVFLETPGHRGWKQWSIPLDAAAYTGAQHSLGTIAVSAFGFALAKMIGAPKINLQTATSHTNRLTEIELDFDGIASFGALHQTVAEKLSGKEEYPASALRLKCAENPPAAIFPLVYDTALLEIDGEQLDFFALRLGYTETGSQVTLDLEYNTNVLNSAIMEKFYLAFEKTMTKMLLH